MCVVVGEWCVHMSIQGVSKAAAVAWRGYASELMFPFGPEYDRVCIFQSAAIRSLCRLPPRYHTRVCVCVVFAEMDADFKPNFPSRRRASSSKTLLSGKYMYLQKNKLLWNDEWRAHFLIDNHVFLKSRVGG